MMKRNAMYVLGVLVILAAGCVSESMRAPKSPPTPNENENGTVSFYEKADGSGGHNCQLPIKGGYIDFGSDPDCTNDQLTYYKISNAHSTTHIRLDSERCEGTTNRWFYELLVTSEPTSTVILGIPELVGHQAGYIVAKGLRLVKVKADDGVKPQGKLSCVWICGPGETCSWATH